MWSKPKSLLEDAVANLEDKDIIVGEESQEEIVKLERPAELMPSRITFVDNLYVPFASVVHVAPHSTMFALSKVEFVNLGCSSRHIFAVMEQHLALSICNPFATHSMLRFKHFARIVHAISLCLPETTLTLQPVQPLQPLRSFVDYDDDLLNGHPLQPYLHLRVTCRWIFQALHVPLKARVNDLLIQLGEMREFQTRVLHNAKIAFGKFILADCERRAIKAVQTQYILVKKMHDAYNEDAFLQYRSKGLAIFGTCRQTMLAASL